MASSTPVILLIADISGFTGFMRRHSVASSHAREITVRLLNAVISRSSYPLKVAEIEGDAVFFYAESKAGLPPESTESIKRQLIGLFRAFRAEALRLQAMDACSCEACSSVSSLVLKQVVHAGEATVERVSRFEKLFSMDVILVHRLLKNSIESRRYILFTKPAFAIFHPFFELHPELRFEDVDDLGRVECSLIHGEPLRALIESEDIPLGTPSWYERMAWRARLWWSERPFTTAAFRANTPAPD